MEQMNIMGCKLYGRQAEIARAITTSDKFYHIIDAGRQTGKSYLAKQLLLFYGLNNSNFQVMFVSMTYSQTTKVYKEMLRLVKPIGVIRAFNRKENSIILKNGSEIYFKSYQQSDNIRGYSNDVLIVDEAAFCDDDDFNSCLKPTLNVKGKKCILFSTPRGFNFFYDMFKYGESGDPRYASYRMDYTTCPFANLEEILDAKAKLPKKIFESEYLGIFAENGISVFENYLSCIGREGLYEGTVVGAIDVGRQNDYTALTIMRGRKVVLQERWRDDTWGNIVCKIGDILAKYKLSTLYVEVNGVGDVFYELISDLYRDRGFYGSLYPWTTTNQTKANIIEKLNEDFNSLNICIPDDKVLIGELANFEATYSKSSRAIVYGARGSQHDDLVMSLAICNYASNRSVTKGSYVFV